MLSATAKLDKLSKIQFPVLVSPKLDGIRCVIRDGVALTRKLKRIPNHYIQTVLCGLPDGLDGELIVGRTTASDACYVTQSGVMSEDGEPDFTYWLFDLESPSTSFQERLANLKEEMHGEARDGYPVKIVPHFEVHSVKDLLKFEQEFVERGYEGIMIRSLDGPYKYGRSTLKEGYLLKLKRFEDAEATIVDYVERMHNTNEAETDERGYAKRSSAKAGKVGMDTLGALVCKTPDGTEFEIGTGFDDAQRAYIWQHRSWYLGSLVTYKHQGHGSKGKPRFPVFLRFRHADDIGGPDAK